MIVYIHPKCSTCQKALKLLNGKNIVTKDITTTPPSISELKHMLKCYGGNIRKLFNTSGQLYREMGLTEKLNDMSEEEALDSLSKNGMLVKRPFLISKDVGLVGFNEGAWSSI